MTDWGPQNPHPLSRMKTELVWEGKYDEYGNRRPVRLPASPLPLQRIETIDQPRDARKAQARQLGLPFDDAEFRRSAHRDDWRNMLIWGDNKLVMAALLEEFRGKIDLIYIDPPFDVGADFTMQVQIGEEGEALQKEQSILEAVAYRDTWGKGTDSYLHMMYERLVLMRDLLSENGNIFVHVDYRVNSLVRLVLEEIFGDQLLNEIIWFYNSGPRAQNGFGKRHDTIFRYGKNADMAFMETEVEDAREPYSPDINIPASKAHYYHPMGKVKGDVWRINIPGQNDKTERTGFNTQKPEALLKQVIGVCSGEGGLVADFFCGSGTTLAVAEKLGRRWIGVDLGRYAIHTTRKRLIQVQRELHEQGKPYRSFDVYNLGRYERQWWQMDRLKGADGEHRRIVLQFYKAAPFLPSPIGRGAGGEGKAQPPHPLLHGKKGAAYVHVDQIDSIFSHEELRAVAEAVRSVGGREVHCLAWEFEMELSRKKEALEAETGVSIRLKYIPREIMEPNRTEVQFFEAGALEARVIWTAEARLQQSKKSKVDVELLRFTPALAEAPEAELAALRERAIRSPFDFIDFWAVDFDYAPDKPFEHHWQDFRTRKDRSLKTRTDIGWHYETPGKHQIAVKVIDVFGVDTTIVLDVEV
nr:site-specific DNA-methyltransferase [Chloroflexota bacterium]